MQVTKEIIDNAISEFSSLTLKNTIDKKNLSKFKNGDKTDDLYFSFIESKDQHYITFLNFLIKKIQPKNVVELGNREGLSRLAIYDAIKKTNSMFYSIDIVKDLRYCPEHMFNDPSMHFLFGDVCSYKIINQLPQQIDFLFTDTMHFYFQLRDEWDVYQHLLSDTALVAIDDINIHDKRKLFDEVNYTKWDLTELCHANGWGLFLFQRKNPVDTLMQKSAVNEALIHIWERKYESLFDQVKSNREQSLPFKIKQ